MCVSFILQTNNTSYRDNLFSHSIIGLVSGEHQYLISFFLPSFLLCLQLFFSLLCNESVQMIRHSHARRRSLSNSPSVSHSHSQFIYLSTSFRLFQHISFSLIRLKCLLSYSFILSIRSSYTRHFQCRRRAALYQLDSFDF